MKRQCGGMFLLRPLDVVNVYGVCVCVCEGV